MLDRRRAYPFKHSCQETLNGRRFWSYSVKLGKLPGRYTYRILSGVSDNCLKVAKMLRYMLGTISSSELSKEQQYLYIMSAWRMTLVRLP